jgi:hypothetical protein
MSRRIAVYVAAGILCVGVATPQAQESIPRPAVVEARDTLASTGVPPTGNDDPNGNIEGRQNSDRSPRDASHSPRAKAGTARRWFAGAMQRMFVFVARGLVYTAGR